MCFEAKGGYKHEERLKNNEWKKEYIKTITSTILGIVIGVSVILLSQYLQSHERETSTKTIMYYYACDGRCSVHQTKSIGPI